MVAGWMFSWGTVKNIAELTGVVAFLTAGSVCTYRG